MIQPYVTSINQFTLLKRALGDIDRIHHRLLKFTLRFRFLRRIYSDDSSYLSFLFSLSVIFSFIFSLTMPLLVLAIGSLAWGIPHVVSSHRAVFKLVWTDRANPAENKAERIVLTSLCALSLTLMFVTLPGAESTRFVEICFSALVIFGIWFGCSRSMLRLVGLLGMTAASVFLFVRMPLETAGALLIAHNWIAFLYWYIAGDSRSDRKRIAVCFAVFVSIQVIVALGEFDFLLTRVTDIIPWTGLSTYRLGAALLPESGNLIHFRRAVAVYAFGQSIHYFIWLKAIPRESSSLRKVASLRINLKRLSNEFGFGVIVGIMFALSALYLVCFFCGIESARSLYLASAAFHGWFELFSVGSMTLQSLNKIDS